MNAIAKLTAAKLMLGMFLFAGPLAMAGQEAGQPAATGAPDGENNQEGILLEEPATSVKEVMERRAKLEAEAAKELEAAQKAYDQRLAAADQQAANNLELIARRAVADGKLADAAKAWEQVLRIDPENKTALEFFKTIGREDVVQKQVAKPARDARRVWRPNGSRVPRFVKQTNGSWIEIRSSGEKKVWSEASSTEHTIELKRPDGQMLRIHRDNAYWTSTNGGWQSGGSGSWDSDN